MRRITLSALLLAGASFTTACEGPEANQPLDLEPSFGVVDASCLEALPGYTGGTKYDLLNEIHQLISELFDIRQSENSAHSHIDNVGRKVCDGDYEAATKMAWSFFLQVDQQVAGQPVKQLPPFTDAFSELMSKTFDLAWEPGTDAPLVVPEGTFRASGGIGVVQTRKGGAVFSRNFQAAAVVDPYDYPAGEEVYIVLSRTPDGELHIPGFLKAFPAGYWIMGSAEPQDNPGDDGILVQMCIEQPVPTNYKKIIRLAHDTGGGSELLDPPVWDGLSIDCSTAGTLASSDPAASPGLLSSLTRWAGGTVRNVFAPALLFAQEAGGVGLGGRTKSFSPFAPVDIYSSLSITVQPEEETIHVGETVQLTATLNDPFDVIPADAEFTFAWASDDASIAGVDADGLVTGVGAGTTVISATLDAPGWLPDGLVVSGEATITVLPLLVLEVHLVNQADMSKELRVSWEPSFGEPTECIADPRTTISCYPEFPAGQQVRFTAEALWPTLPNSNVPGFDIWITPGGDGCTPHQQGPGIATCFFTMPSVSSTIEFRQVNGGGG